MSVTMEIRENGHVILYQYREPFDLRDLNPLYDQDKKHRDSVDYTVHTLLDMSGVHRLPQGIIGARLNSPVLYHVRAGVTVVVCAEGFTKAIAEMVLRLSRKEAKFFNTADEGWAFLRTHIQATQPDSIPANQTVIS